MSAASKATGPVPATPEPSPQAGRSRAVEFDALFRAESPALLRFLRRRTRNSDDAADLLQETFARFARVSFREEIGKPAAYLQRIAGNLLADRARTPVHSIAQVSIDDLQLLDPAPSPFDHVETREMVRHLATALSQLPPKTQQVYLLNRFERLTYERIAARLGMSPKGVEKHMGKAIAHLDRRLYGR